MMHGSMSECNMVQILDLVILKYGWAAMGGLKRFVFESEAGTSQKHSMAHSSKCLKKRSVS